MVSSVSDGVTKRPKLIHAVEGPSHYLKDDDQLVLSLNRDSKYEATWEPRNNVREEAISRCFARFSKACPERYK